MKQVTINAKTDIALKDKASELADELGISLSVVINTALRNFVAERSLTVSEDYIPNKYLEDAIKTSRGQYKKGEYVSASSSEELDDLLGL